MYGVPGKRFQKQYKNRLSDFRNWTAKAHAERWLIYPQNISPHLSIDEVALSRGELYTIVTAKEGKGKKGCLVAIIKDTFAETVIHHLNKIAPRLRESVREITLDMSGSMKLIAKRCFPKATQVIDRFHVQQLAGEALQDIRIKYRWEAIEEENNNIQQARSTTTDYSPFVFSNGDTRKQLLARSRHLLYKNPACWTEAQEQRAEILFEQYGDLKKAYQLTQGLRQIYNNRLDKNVAMTKLAHWYKEVEDAGFKTFNTLLKTISIHYNDILNYFNNRSTNASAESFNAKIKRIRTNFRGVKDTAFFLFRIKNIFS